MSREDLDGYAGAITAAVDAHDVGASSRPNISVIYGRILFTFQYGL